MSTKKKDSLILNDNADVFVGAGFTFYQEAIKSEIKEINKMTYNNQCLIGTISALIALSERFPRLAYLDLDPRDIAEWKSVFLTWLDSKYSKVPSKVKEEFKKYAIEEFDHLHKLISKGVS